MKRMHKLILTLSLVIVALCCFGVCSSAASGNWVGAWSTAVTNISLKNYDNISFAGTDLTGRTLLTPTASGSKIRVRFSNYYGDSDLIIDSATVADSAGGDETSSAIVPSSIAPLSFGGKKQVTIKAGEEVVSDPVTYNVTALKPIAVSYHIPKGTTTEIKTMGLSGGKTYLTFEGDQTSQENFNLLNGKNSKYLKYLDIFGLDKLLDLSLSYKLVSVIPILSGVDVYANNDAYSVCVIGDSTVANQFPLYLAQNIVNNYNTTNVGVLGKGVIGNTLASVVDESLGSMVYGEALVDRFARDCTKQANVKYVIVKIGANDIIHPVCTSAAEGSKQPSANQLIANLQNVCDKAHAAGMKVILGTITQWKGCTRDYFGMGGTYIRTEAEQEADWAIAKKVNKWITSSDNKYTDGYFDFATLSKSKVDPDAFDSAYSDDWIHPNDTLQKLWAEKFNMSLIGVSNKVGSIKLSASSKTINVGKTATVKVTSIIPDEAANKKVTWSSSNTAVATVNSNGKITAVANGSCNIICKAADGSGVNAKVKVTVVTPVTGVSVSPASKTIYTRDTLTLTATVAPKDASNKKVTWSSSNNTIAKVSSKGVVTAVKSGKVTITATTDDGAKKATATIKVKKRIDVSEIITNVAKKSIYVGKTAQLAADVYPTDATYPQIKWTSSNKAVATVDQNGKVTAVAAGTCTVKVKSIDNPSVSASVAITVGKHVSSVKLSPQSATVTVGYTKQLTTKISPASALNKKVTYSSSDKSVAKVSSSGVVTAVGKGVCNITVKTVDGSYTATSSIVVIPVVKSKSVSLNAKTKTIYAGSKFTLTSTVNPSNTTNKAVTWTSTDSSVAKVNSKGVVTAVKAGKATIVCVTKDSAKSAKCVITVKNVVPTKVTLSYPKLSLKVGESSTLRGTVAPSNATIKTLKWSSSNPKVATVSSNGKVKAVKAGTATITCTTVSGKKVAKCKVTVSNNKVTSIKLSKTKLSLTPGKTSALKATVAPSNATIKKVSWTSSNSKVAKVSSSGVVTAVGRGTATITCKATDGSGKTAKCSVTVF